MKLNKYNIPEHLMGQIKRLLEDIGEEYKAGKDPIGFRSTVRGIVFGGTNGKSSDWRNAKSRTCAYPKCSSEAIGSHTIQEGGSVAVIAEKNSRGVRFVIGPTWNAKDGLKIEEIPTSQASVFPGFCEVHDPLLFIKMERQKCVIDDYDVRLQVYRSYQRERLRLAHDCKQDQDTYDRLRSHENREVHRYISDRIPRGIINVYKDIEKLSFTGSAGLSQRFKLAMDGKRRLLKRVEESKTAMDYFIVCPEMHPIGIDYVAFDIPVSLPVTLSGVGALRAIDHTDRFDRPIFMVVLPAIDSTKIILFSRVGNMEMINKFLGMKGIRVDSMDRDSLLNAISLVEQFMLMATDHWFVKPSFWNGLAEGIKEEILRYANEAAADLLDKWDLEIFEGSRREVCALLP